MVSQSDSRCAGCQAVYYCGRPCQVQDWKKRHKKECRQLQAGATPAVDADAAQRTRFEPTQAVRGAGRAQLQQQALAAVMFDGDPPGHRWTSARTPW